MDNLNRILVPTDFSDASEHALRVAADLAKENNAQIVALHMLDIPETLINKEESQEYGEVMFFMKLANKRFKNFLDKDFLNDVEVKEAVQHHQAFSGIIESAKKENSDLIVMGSHGASGLKELFVGSNTEKVVRTSDIPVLVIKDYETTFSPRKMIFACNFVDDCLDAFSKANDMANSLNSEIELLYVNTPSENFKSSTDINARVKSFLEKSNVNNASNIPFHVFNDYSVEDGILHFSEENNADLIAIPTHGRKGIAHMLMGSIGEKVANHAARPVMTFKI